jgi:phosphatidylglycerol:prolipoprotein diacylglycerol transferase
LRLWEGGLSVYGGFIACVVVGLYWLRKHRINVYRYADYCLFGLPFGYAIGRIGCFLIHDHPGTATDFILGVQYPDGEVRHDLGLYLSIQAAILALIFLWISRRPRPVGTYIAGFCVWYGVVRFFLDYLRVIDVRYWGLTPAQYLSVFLLGFGLWQFCKIKRNSTL